MNKKSTQISILGTIGIALMFVMSILWPQTQLVAKIVTIAIFSFICFLPLYQQKKAGEDVNRNIGFTIALILILAYVLFF